MKKTNVCKASSCTDVLHEKVLCERTAGQEELEFTFPVYHLLAVPPVT